tara:strand:+ start:277 stop:2598 length:2322 start_codon:yes stop_codon:yes gene_type:complete
MVVKKDKLKKIKDSIGSHRKETSRQANLIFVVIGTATGFISDILQPLAAFSSYLFFASAVSSLCIYITLRVKQDLRSKIIPSFLISLSLMVVSGAMFLLHTDETKESGVLANALPGIKSLQSSMGLIQKDISEIKETAKRIEEFSARTEETVRIVEENTKETAEATKKIAGSIDAVFNELLKGGGIIKSPTKPEEFYANARMYEQKGDSGNARRSFAKFFQFDLDYVDPHLRYQKYLKVQEGREGAREIYFEMKEDSKSFITEFASILLFNRSKRIKKLQEFILKHPEFGPGYLELSKDFSKARLGEQTQRDKGNEKKYLEKFFQLHEEGKFLKYFMDKDMASKFINNAGIRMTALNIFDESILKNPIQLSANKNAAGWSFTATTIDAISELFYSFEGDDKFISTGFMDFLDPKTGKKMPNRQIRAPASFSKTKIYLKYRDLKGEVHGPFEIVFDQGLTLRDNKIASLKRSHNWTSYRYFGDVKGMYRDLFYFTTLQSHACGIEKAMYAWNDDKKLDQKLPIQECDPDNPGMVSGNVPSFFDAPPGTNFFAVQVFFKDGTKSKVRIHKKDFKKVEKGRNEQEKMYGICGTPDANGTNCILPEMSLCLDQMTADSEVAKGRKEQEMQYGICGTPGAHEQHCTPPEKSLCLEQQASVSKNEGEYSSICYGFLYEIWDTKLTDKGNTSKQTKLINNNFINLQSLSNTMMTDAVGAGDPGGVWGSVFDHARQAARYICPMEGMDDDTCEQVGGVTKEEHQKILSGCLKYFNKLLAAK